MTTKKKAGRPKGSLDMRSRNLRQSIQAIGLTPLEYMLQIMADTEQDQSTRIDAAKAAAPYCHARLQSVIVQEKPYEGDPNSITNEQLAGIITGGGSIDDDAEETGSKLTH